MIENKLGPLLALLDSTTRVAVLTGSGISAESGIPTFRGKHGLWKQFRAEEQATPQAFERDRQLVCKCKGDTILCPYLVGSAPKDDTVENRQGQGIMSPKVIYGQQTSILTS